MTVNITASACFFIVLLILLLDFSSKEKLDNLDNNSFRHLSITCLIGLLLEFLNYFLVTVGLEISSKIMLVLGRAMFLYYVFYMYYFIIYAYTTCKKLQKRNEKYDLFKRVLTFVYIFFGLVILVLPFDFSESVEYLYPTGLATTVSYIIGGVGIMYILGLSIANFKNLKQQKAMPILWGLIGAIISLFVQNSYHQLLLLIPAHAISIVIMYFTIENPDIKMLNELYKNRELMEQGYEDKYNFLFEITQDAKKPLLDLNRVCNEIRLEDDPKKVKEGLAIINNITRQLDFSINNVLNVSSFDAQKLKIIDTKYDVLKVCELIEATVRAEIKNDVSFNVELPKSVPTLYGDYMKLRQIIYSLLNNACKNTDNGSVNLRLNVIEKYDFCRLIFNISDTGKGMSIEKINDILSATGELDKSELELLEKKEFNFKVCQKVVKIMGGNLMIKSTIGRGTEITLTLDQRVYHEKENSILNRYESSVASGKKVLIVAQDKDLSNYIKKKLNDNKASYSALAYGGDAVDRIKAGKSYDYILVEDDMKEMSGLATLQELQKLKGFDMPVIVMLNSSKDSIKEHYIEDGFADYLLTDNLEEEINRIIDKY